MVDPGLLPLPIPALILAFAAFATFSRFLHLFNLSPPRPRLLCSQVPSLSLATRAINLPPRFGPLALFPTHSPSSSVSARLFCGPLCAFRGVTAGSFPPPAPRSPLSLPLPRRRRTAALLFFARLVVLPCTALFQLVPYLALRRPLASTSTAAWCCVLPASCGAGRSSCLLLILSAPVLRR